MLRINSLKINVNTSKGLYGLSLNFSEKLNIIRGNNSSGKSTIFQSILYGIGMEELIGNKNDKAMQSVLKKEVLNDDKIKEADVLESSIQLEISNATTTITTERFVKSENKDPRLIKVYHGPLLTGEKKELQSDSMFVHDPGAASDIKFGFFAFFENFLGYSLPQVQYNDGAMRKLYLQNIFPALVIEQKVGWSDFLSTIPFYNLRDKERRGIEFLLKLDSWNIEEKRQEIRSEKQRIEADWESKFFQLEEVAKRGALEIQGIENKPIILNGREGIYLSYTTNEKVFALNEYITALEIELEKLETKEIPKIQEIAKEKEKELSEASELYSRFSIRYKNLIDNKNLTSLNIRTIQERLKQIEEELIQNKHHKKVKEFGAENDIKVAKDICPTCSHSLNDSLLPVGTLQIPMNIDENIGYLEAQRAMAKSYIESHESQSKKYEREVLKIEELISETRTKIRAIKIDLVTDDRLPSIELIEKRIRLKSKVDFYRNTREEFNRMVDLFLAISKEWSDALAEEKKLPKKSFSRQDETKLQSLQNEFIRLLRKFEYGSKPLSELRISPEKLIPVADGYYSIRFDSSASDLVRAIAAFSIALNNVSKSTNANHPNLIMFDEPGTQETAATALRDIFSELAVIDAQSIAFASFKQSDTDFQESTEGVTFNLIKPKGKKFIRQVSSTVGITGNKKIENYKRWIQNGNSDIEIIELSAAKNNLSDVKRCDGIVFSGGKDIHPRFYKNTNINYLDHPKEFDEDRDEFELSLFKQTQQLNIPVLGICRGMQLINIALGGDLIQDLEPEKKGNHIEKAKDLIHNINVVENSLLHKITKTKTGSVNSSHHQAIGRLSDELIINSVSVPDNVIEGVERNETGKGPWLLCVQWHPERLDEPDNPFSKDIRTAFLVECAKKHAM